MGRFTARETVALRASQMDDDVVQAGLGLVYGLSSAWLQCLTFVVIALGHMEKESAWEGPDCFCSLCWVGSPGRSSWDTEQKVYVLWKSKIFALAGNVRDTESSPSFDRGGT